MNYTETTIFRKTARRLDNQTRAELVEILAQIEEAATLSYVKLSHEATFTKLFHSPSQFPTHYIIGFSDFIN